MKKIHFFKFVLTAVLMAAASHAVATLTGPTNISTLHHRTVLAKRMRTLEFSHTLCRLTLTISTNSTGQLRLLTPVFQLAFQSQPLARCLVLV
jgi:hypothetical protein